MTLEIIPFKPEYSQDFYNLNTEWLEKYFYVEPYDEKVLASIHHIHNRASLSMWWMDDGEIRK